MIVYLRLFDCLERFLDRLVCLDPLVGLDRLLRLDHLVRLDRLVRLLDRLDSFFIASTLLDCLERF